MKRHTTATLTLLLCLLTLALESYAQRSVTPRKEGKAMTAPKGGKPISDQLIGIFFEDISFAADGGLNAELVQNGSFEYSPVERDGWGATTAWRMIRPGHALGTLEVKQQEPIHPNNPNYIRLYVERTRHFHDYNGWVGFGLQNDGFGGINLMGGKAYDFSVFLRLAGNEAVEKNGAKGKAVRIVLAQPQPGAPKLLAEDTLRVDSPEWKRYACTLTPSEDCANAVLQLLVLDQGVVDVDMVSLMPQDTYHGHGLRRDLAEALEALHPRFMRFPGGCVVHGGGDGFWNTYRWKETIGPKEARRQQKNTWGYHQSLALGYHEYFQFCEDMGMEPLPILPCGVNCQGSNGGWGIWPQQAQDAVPMNEMDEWVQDALDLIEWANGDSSTTWGRKRAEAGHPEPFNLKYLGLGNEEKITPEFCERFRYLYDKVTAAHPEIIVVGTAGPGSHAGNPDYDRGWQLAEELGVPILDEHYYEQRDYFQNSRQYDAYPRDRKTKVYLGEYASKGKTLIDALAEALYLLHVERNGDVVCMTSFAPLFSRRDATFWHPNLIYFDNQRTMLTCNYYVQQMFGQSAGQYYYGDCVEIENPIKSDGDGYLQEQSVVLNVKTRTLYVKVCNIAAKEKKAQLDLTRFKPKADAVKTVLSGLPGDDNDFDHQPVLPKEEAIKVSGKMSLTLPPYSLTMLTIKL